jgi:PPOX class probable F420-dependent enzyme
MSRELQADNHKKERPFMNPKTTHATRKYLTTPGKGHMTLLTSFRRNGTGVGTPVGTVASNGTLYFMTAADTWKAKRLAHNPRVTLAPGNRKGEALGPAIEGKARRLYAEEAKRARGLLRIGIVGRFFGIIFDRKYPGEKTAVYEIVLDARDTETGKEAQLPASLPL